MTGCPRSSTSSMALPSSRTPSAPDEPGVPALVGHLAAARIEPGDVLDVRAAHGAPAEEAAAPEHRLLVADANEPARELEELTLRGRQVP